MNYYFLLLLFPLTAIADSSVFMKYGVGIGNSGISTLSETKVVSLGVSSPIASEFRHKGEVGYWYDYRTDLNRKSSFFGSYQLGLEIKNDIFIVDSYHGIGAVSSVDAYLGSNLQFFHDVCLGLTNRKDKSISLCYKHISNAGLFSDVNVGRDFINVRLGF